MSKKDYKIIAESIWRSGALLDRLEKNKVKRKAKKDMQRLIANNLIGSLKNDNSDFNGDKFLRACGFEN